MGDEQVDWQAETYDQDHRTFLTITNPVDDIKSFVVKIKHF